MKILAFLIFSSLGVTAFAGWKDRPSVVDEYSVSTTAFVGEVIGAKDVPESEDFIRGTFYTIRVHEVLKGKPQASVEVYSENSSGRFSMAVGSSYLVFTSEQVFEGIDGSRLAINAAGNSSLMKDAGEALLAVRKLSKNPPNQALQHNDHVRHASCVARVTPAMIVADL